MNKIICFFATILLLTSAIPSKFAVTSQISKSTIFSFNGLNFDRSLAASESDFTDLYAVIMPNDTSQRQKVLELGMAVSAVNMPVVLMHVEPIMIENMSAYLHQFGIACGGVVKLNGKTVVRPKFQSAEPIIDISEKNEIAMKIANGISADNIQDYVMKLVNMETRFHNSSSGKKVAATLADWYKTYAGDRDDVEIMEYKHKNTKQNSLVVRIKGSTYPEDIVVLGSHLDSITFSTKAPGADDNASGTSTNLEVFRNLMINNFKPQRTVEIHAYAAEEIGLVGSQEIAEEYAANDKINVVSMMQIDMDLYVEDGEPKIWLVNNDTDDGLNSDLEVLVDNYTGLKRDSATLTAGTSDHLSWTNEGIPAAFPFENPNKYNKNIHTTKDLPNIDGISWTQAQGFAKLAASYITHFAGY